MGEGQIWVETDSLVDEEGGVAEMRGDRFKPRLDKHSWRCSWLLSCRRWVLLPAVDVVTVPGRPKMELLERARMFKFFGINLSARDKKNSRKTLAFSTNQKFKSREELLEWTQNTASSLGYAIVTRRSKAYGNGFVYKVILICDRGREFKPKEYTSRASGIKRTNCQFQLERKYSKEYDKWTLRTRLVANLTRKNMVPRDILSTLKVQNENNVSTIKTIYYAQQKIRMHEQPGRTPMHVLMSLLHTNDYVYEFTTNDSNELENLFFIHPTSWKIWRAFPHVLITDATYKTNKYNKPFVQIVGVTSTQKTFSVGFAFIHREKEANYTWVLNCLNSTLDTWHIEQNILKHRNKIITLEDDRGSFRSLWNLLVESPTLMDYTENCMRLQSMLIKYLRKIKEMFVSVWINQHLNFGNNTTNRVESAYANLKRFLDSANSNLDRFVQRINEIVQRAPKDKCVKVGLLKLWLQTLYQLWISFGESLVFMIQSLKIKDDIRCDDEVEKYKENFNKQEKSYLKKLKEIYDPHTINVGELTVQNKTRGRSTLPRCNDSTTSNFIGLDLNKEPERNNYSYDIDLNGERQMQDPFLMKSIHDVFHDYIDNIQDVLGDGNCRFRAVAVSLGDSEDQCYTFGNNCLKSYKVNFMHTNEFLLMGSMMYTSLCVGLNHLHICDIG
uniref:MULE transposase domain-containing protein n=1 Tax=Lactuca sativa TaxID=4236 RepID=A0A9R1WM64_LACSA|nr:hypothetical protein LSAT_V11C100046460 [Lactuca sativa]